ncbi:MAG: FAD-linked oxidase C-terminal domain-containing protein [Candidatus Eisenbacteria bacterium]
MNDRGALLAALGAIFPPDRLILEPEQLLTYECDGHTLERALPSAIVIPTSTAEIQETLRVCHERAVPFVARGTGTGLSGGALALDGAVVIALTLLDRILSIDVANRSAVVQPGVINARLSRAAAPHGLCYAPDPSSQGACTLGGNVAENSGGPHTLKYGVTTNHVLGLELVLPDGELLRLGSENGSSPGYDLRGVLIGAEGTFGIVSEITVRLTPLAPAVATFLAVYDSIDAACETVSAIIGGGTVPAALELIDHVGIVAVESHLKVGYPLDAQAVLLIELEGSELEVDAAAERTVALCREHAAREVRRAASAEERAALWKGRKQALGALGRLAPAYYTLDGVVPRARVPEAIRRIGEIGAKHGLRIANVCHAGDGNMHPLILFDPEKEGEVDRVHQAGEAILRMCVELGGALSGEHGIGIEKRELMPLCFSADDLAQMMRVRDCFDPETRCNRGKIFPTGAPTPTSQLPRRVGGWM